MHSRRIAVCGRVTLGAPARSTQRRLRVLLFKKPFHAGLLDGSIRLTFRSWAKPHVRAGGRYRCHPIGVLEVDDVRLVRIGDIPESDAELAGFASRDALLEFLRSGPGGDALSDEDQVYRVALHHGGDGDRVELALEDQLSEEDVRAIAEKLARMDRDEPWTAETLALVEKHPRVAASQLAARVGRETEPFKIDVRKLKKLGLTQSFEVGYELSPRGRAFLAKWKRPPKKRAKKAGIAARTPRVRRSH